MLRGIILIVLIIVAQASFAQELNCLVTINANQVQTTDQNVFKDMKISIEQFMNGRKWTNDQYRNHEKINCNFLITITKMPSIGSFTASVQIRSSRPVYKTNYSSLVLNFADRDWEFEYIESMPLQFNDNSYSSNLTSLLAYYAYLILGFDYDTFSETGGSPFFQKALQVVNNAQASSRPGWQAMGSNRNRYWMIENINNPLMAEARKGLYAYHRLGLDIFGKDPDQGRQSILKCLRELKKIRDINPSSIYVVSFLDAKGKELTNLFSEGNLQARREVYDIVVAIDPSNRTAYDKIIQNN